MKAVIQRVDGARLYVGGEVVASIGRGLAIYLGIEQSDVESNAIKFCQKVAAMRIFPDGDGKMNLSVADIGGDILLVPNFTLCADISHGNRPSFVGAMRPPLAAEMRPPLAASAMFNYCVGVMRDVMRSKESAGGVECGIFGADMTIEQVNAGPVTIIY